MPKSFVIAMIGPDSLKEGFTVLLQSARQVESLIYASSRGALREIVGVLVPDLIIVHVAASKKACKAGQVSLDDIGKLQAVWPDAHSIALLDEPNMQKKVEDLGIDLSLLEGVAPTRLLYTVEKILAGQQRGQNHSIAY